MKVYEGDRRHGRLEVWVRDSKAGGGESCYRLPHLVHHSPDGFECGYAGSGPADLALALCADMIGEEDETVDIYRGSVGRRAWDAHQSVKRVLVANLPRDGSWRIHEEELRAALAEAEQPRYLHG